MAECPGKQQRHSGAPGDDPWTECGRAPADLVVPCVGEEKCAVLRSEAAEARVKALDGALNSMLWQFAYLSEDATKGDVLHTGGLSALKEAFDVMGWSDPITKDEALKEKNGG